ncbi:LysR family transcriptional regulator [Moritella marina ATCC 15381]|uniref:LysR family transcriptional regulator n=1 Tax=Moritella marina ATCC 15381 TaxID=1202962 RepID=A0A5J6WNJ7_MORMI|nr:LysR family transcriptional regulator [Moritella marina]QFI38738.1 LysR family transcriptional regulator [Moritella marina ATCC 15381]
MLNSKILHYFATIVTQGSYTKAAEHLGIAQSALSIAMRKFEEQLGMPLLIRSSKGVVVTKEGEVLLVHSKDILARIHDAETALNDLRGLEQGEVSIGIPGMMGSYFFPEILMAFKFKYPNLKLSIMEGGTQTIKEKLLSGELDLGVIVDDHLPDSLQVQRFVRPQMVAAVGKNHALAGAKSVTYANFFTHELVMFKAGYFHREVIDGLCEANNMTVNYSFETNLITMILNIVKNEFAITALLELVTDQEADVMGIPFDPPIYLDLALAWRKDGYLSLANRRFVEFTLAQVNK